MSVIKIGNMELMSCEKCGIVYDISKMIRWCNNDDIPQPKIGLTFWFVEDRGWYHFKCPHCKHEGQYNY